MRRAAIFPFLGPALILYLVADVSSAVSSTTGVHTGAGLDRLGEVIAALATLLGCALLGQRDPNQERGARRAGYLGLAAGGSLLRLLSNEPLRISVDIAEAIALASLAALVLDLALTVPDVIVPARYRRAARVLPYALGLGCALLSALALGPVFAPLGSPLLVPARCSDAAAGYAALSVLVALGLRLSRRRFGSTPEALASNGWAVLALAPAMLVAATLVVGRVFSLAIAASLLRVSGSVAAVCLYLGHVWLIDPRRRLAAGPTLREIVSAVLATSAVALAAMPLRAYVPATPLAFALWVAAALCLGLALFQAFTPLLHRTLAPAGGRLLDATRTFPETTAGIHTLPGLARAVLGCMRKASGSPNSVPLLYGFDPAFEARIDAAGEAHLAERPLPAAIAQRLRENPAEIIVRAPLEAQIVRNPPLRPLIEALIEHDVLCVLPLVTDGELEGALIVPRGNRRSLLTLEELGALREHARYLSALLSIFAAQGRTELRAHELLMAQQRAQAQGERLEDELSRLRSDVELLHGGRNIRAEASPLIAYSPAMRALTERVRSLASLEVPVCLLGEPGLPIEALARLLHTESGRSAEPFVAVACAALRADESAAVLFGGAHGDNRHAGALRIAGAGTLLLGDVAALSLDAQRQLAVALASRGGRTVDGGESYPVLARVVLGTRVDLDALAGSGHFDADLAARLSPVSLRVPPLRECPEDIESHVLLALDRACRLLGRDPIGFDPDALAALAKYAWPDNLAELTRVVERALAHARGERVVVSDLMLDTGAAALLGDNPLIGTLEEVERRALEHALLRAAGNKSEAARLLGLPRTTLLDKLRRHKLDDGARESSAPAN